MQIVKRAKRHNPHAETMRLLGRHRPEPNKQNINAKDSHPRVSLAFLGK